MGLPYADLSACSLYQTYKKLVFQGCMREPLYKGHGSKADPEAAFRVTYWN